MNGGSEGANESFLTRGERKNRLLASGRFFTLNISSLMFYECHDEDLLILRLNLASYRETLIGNLLTF